MVLNSPCVPKKMVCSLKVLIPALVWQERKQKDCNRFHAGEVLPALRSKGKNWLFDEKGVFGRACRHDFPKSLLNIKQCERWEVKPYFCKVMVHLKCADIFPNFQHWGREIHVKLIWIYACWFFHRIIHQKIEFFQSLKIIYTVKYTLQ